MEVKCITRDTLPYSALSEFQGNLKARTDSDYEKIENSIKKHGFSFPFFVWRDGDINYVLDGHGRLGALSRMVASGETLPELPVVYVDCKTEAEAKELLLKLNSHYGEMTAESVQAFIGDLQINIDELALPAGVLDLSLEIPKTEKEVSEDHADLTPPEEPKAKRGYLYQLGEHRLLCGDSTNPGDLKVLMQGEQAPLCFTDPPYGMKKESAGVSNDNLNYDDLLEFNKKWIPLAMQNLTDVGSFYCWGIDEPLMDIYSGILRPLIKKTEITFRNLITWDKGHGQGQNSEEYRMYARADEKCLFWVKGCQGWNNNADNYYEGFESVRVYLSTEYKKLEITQEKLMQLTNTYARHYFGKSQWSFITREHYEILQAWARENNRQAFQKSYDDIKRQYDDIKRQWYETRAYFNNTHDNQNNVWHFNTTSKKERESAGGHATPKPLALCARAIKTSSRENDIVLDVFGGSGSTLIACEQLNRKARLIEFEPKWVDVIIRRWETLTGKKAILLNGDKE